MAKVSALIPREKVKKENTWDLSSLFKSDADWEKAFDAWQKQFEGYSKYKGHLAESAEMLAACLKFDAAVDRAADALGNYAGLKVSEDQTNSASQRMQGRFKAAITTAAEVSSYIRPEIMAIPAAKMKQFLKDKLLSDWQLALDRLLRYRPHTLGKKEEQLLAMQGQMAGAAGSIFRQLNDADLKWPAIKNEDGEQIELGHSSFSAFLHSPSRAVRRQAFDVYYQQFESHRHSLTAALNGSAERDAYYAKARGYPSAREASLFHDNVPVSVYDNLISAVRKNLPAVHRYYDVRRRAMKIKDGLHFYDTYVPILSDLEKRRTWEQAVKAVIDSLAPLGDEYCSVLKEGLTTARWSDRFPNRGKRSGAFSSGCYDSVPFIMMNYQPTVLDHVFTLAHEAGHSMHSWYSRRNQPYQYHGYPIFVAEVASTFNEQLLARHLMAQAKSDRERAYLINLRIDGMRGTIVRQTMFAEFEKVTHDLVEAGEPLTVETVRAEYRKLLSAYLGPAMVIDAGLELECLRIPHFYDAFYVYKYATGLCAAITLSERVVNGGADELSAYLGFLKGGGSKWPLELLRDAGVDMTTPQPVDSALRQFGELVDELDSLL